MPGLAGGADAEPRGEGEGAALARLALDINFSAHERNHLERDGQAQSRAAVFACDGTVRLLEGLEKFSALIGRHADAGVLDGETQQGFRFVREFRADLHDDLAGLREFHRVADEVEHDLTQPVRVAHDCVGNI